MNIAFVDWLAGLFALLHTISFIVALFAKLPPQPLSKPWLALYIVAIAWLLSRCTS